MHSYRCLMLATIMLAPVAPAPQGTAEPQGGGDPKPTVGAKQEAGKKPEGDRVVLTDRAAARVRQLFMKSAAKYLRVSVSGGDALELKLDLDSEMDKQDLLGESRGVPVVVDPKSAALLPVGIVVDFIDQGGTTGFKFASPGAEGPPDTTVSLAEARRGFKTTLRKAKAAKAPVPVPPRELFQVVRYEAVPGKLSAYLTPNPKDGKKRPAVVWITGGDCNSIDAGCWLEGQGGNDQSASAYRKAGIVMMFPALRGGNDNPGTKEGFLCEVDDVLAAAAFLRKQPYVDPARVYLGGHSTGGTLALLTAEYSDTFRAVFSFGPTDDVLGYGLGNINPFSIADPKELQLRSP